MPDFAKINKKWWDNATAIHASSDLYAIDEFKKGKSSLQSIERKELGNIKGKKLLHLLCHFGMDTLSLAREGAVVTGVDISSKSIALAKKLSNELHIQSTFICSDVYDIPKVLDEKYDIIFMSYGVLLWLSDLPKWANLVKRFLKPGGFIYIVELHPFTNMLGEKLDFSYKYFEKGPYLEEADGTYTDWEAKISGDTYIWFYTLGDIINSLVSAGLKIEFLHEFPFTMYDQFPGYMKTNKKGQYVLKNTSLQVPLLFSLKALF